MNPHITSALSLRRRSVWEAADSGILLWRSNFVHFIPVFVIPVWISACALRLLPGEYTYLSYLVLWWLKPLFDRLVLHVVSTRFFGGASSGRHAFFRNLFSGLVGDLLWRRFSPGRAARLPIRVLERIGRKQYILRKRNLAAGGLNFCFLLSILGLALEGMLLLSEIVFVMIAAQIFSPAALGYMRNNLETMEILIFAAFCLNYILAESLYVCMGFGLYINSRVEVEGWDLQLLFQKFAGERKQSAAAGAVLFVCLFLALAPAIHADPEAPEPQSAVEEAAEEEETREAVVYFPETFPEARSLKELETILASPDFGSEKEGWEIRLKEREEKKKLPSMDLDPLLKKIRQFFAYMLVSLAVIVLVGFAAFTFYWLWKKYRGRTGLRRDKGKLYSNPLLSPESPETLFAKAQDLFRQGRIREAWAACLSGCIGAYTNYFSLSFPVQATEYGCLELVKKALPNEAGGFADLVQSWILFAYGGRAPGQGAFEKALAYGCSLGAANEP